MSELSNELLSRGPINWGCGIATLRDELHGDELVALNTALERIMTDPGKGRSKVYSSMWLANVLVKHGHQISRSTIERHIKGKCSCGKP